MHCSSNRQQVCHNVIVQSQSWFVPTALLPNTRSGSERQVNPKNPIYDFPRVTPLCCELFLLPSGSSTNLLIMPYPPIMIPRLSICCATPPPSPNMVLSPLPDSLPRKSSKTSCRAPTSTSLLRGCPSTGTRPPASPPRAGA